jgi:hypothetical protein
MDAWGAPGGDQEWQCFWDQQGREWLAAHPPPPGKTPEFLAWVKEVIHAVLCWDIGCAVNEVADEHPEDARYYRPGPDGKLQTWIVPGGQVREARPGRRHGGQLGK